MRPLITLLLAIALAGCASAQGTPAATPPPQPTIPAVAEGLVGQPEGRIEVIGYLYRADGGAALVGGLSYGQGDTPTPLAEAGQIWLPTPPALPADSGYQIVRARGQLHSAGGYGPGGAYAHQLTDALVEPLSVRDLSLELLLDNSGIYDNQPVRISGQLLLSQSTALLVDQLGSGGVPTASAKQIKLLGPIDGKALRARLTASSGGSAHFGPVQIVGIWRRSSLYPLAILPR